MNLSAAHLPEEIPNFLILLTCLIISVQTIIRNNLSQKFKEGEIQDSMSCVIYIMMSCHLRHS